MVADITDHLGLKTTTCPPSSHRVIFSWVPPRPTSAFMILLVDIIERIEPTQQRQDIEQILI